MARLPNEWEWRGFDENDPTESFDALSRRRSVGSGFDDTYMRTPPRQDVKRLRREMGFPVAPDMPQLPDENDPAAGFPAYRRPPQAYLIPVDHDPFTRVAQAPAASGVGGFAKPQLNGPGWLGKRESDMVEDRRLPIKPEFGPMSVDDLLRIYNAHGAKPRTPETLNSMRELLYELERRGHIQLEKPRK